MRPAALLLLVACTGDPEPKPPPAPAWIGGSVQAVSLPDGGLAVLDMAWRSDTPMLSPDRVPAEGTVSMRRFDRGGAMLWETVLVDGERARALDLEVRADGSLVALVVAPGLPEKAGLVPVSDTGGVGRMRPLGDALNVKPRVLHADAKGRIFVAGATAVPLYGSLQSPEKRELDDQAGFIGRLDEDLGLEWAEMWDAPGLQQVNALDSGAHGVRWVGTSRVRRGATGTAWMGRFGRDTAPPQPIEGLVEATALALDVEGAYVGGWAATGEGREVLPGSTPMAPVVLAVGEDQTPRWRVEGCCSDWAHTLDLRLYGETLLVGGRAEAATLELGSARAPGGAGVQAFTASIRTADGSVTGLHGLGRVLDTPLDLPVTVLPPGVAPCVVAGAGTPPMCPG